MAVGGERERQRGGEKDYTERKYTTCIGVGIGALPKRNLDARGNEWLK